MKGMLWVLALGLPLLAFDLGRRVLATNDETRFPVLARDILANGHWLLPGFDGVPHLNKPPGYAWLVALVSWPFGEVTQWSAALSAVIAALVMLAAIVWIGERLFGADVATVGGLIAVTTYGVFLHARIPMPDIALGATFALAMAAYVAAT